MSGKQNQTQQTDQPKEEIESFSIIPAEDDVKDNPDAVKVRIRRVPSRKTEQSQDVPIEPVICVSVSYKGEYKYWRPDAAKQIFDVDILTARAAVQTGGFEVDPKSRVKLKEV